MANLGEGCGGSTHHPWHPLLLCLDKNQGPQGQVDEIICFSKRVGPLFMSRSWSDTALLKMFSDNTKAPIKERFALRY